MTDAPRPAPPDQPERERALDATRSLLVRAPAGSGKTDLLTRRFLRLLAEVDSPSQIAAITFTRAAAAEMRHRILAELEKAAQAGDAHDPFAMEALAQRALARSRAMGWNLIELPAQLRISTIDSFCRELALQQPLLAGLGGALEISDQPQELYRRAARRTLARIEDGESSLRAAIETLLLWRDNSWFDMENQLAAMLEQRDRWMHGFVLDRDPDWESLREELERPFAREVRQQLIDIDRLLDQVPGAREEALALARFACEQSEGKLFRELAELAEFPAGAFDSPIALDEARQAFLGLAGLLLTGSNTLRKRIDKSIGFPADRKREKARLQALIAALATVPGLEPALAAVRSLPPTGYSEEEWAIVRACFTLLRHAAAELRVVFAEAGAADYTEVAQIALHVLLGEEGLPCESALAAADGIRHLLVDEFQDTSRRQHQLLSHLVAAWPERAGRTCFVVGDPMQSIYFFRGADAELFSRVETLGLEVPGDQPFAFDAVQLRANFRTAPPLVEELNTAFEKVFAKDDGSGVGFTAAAAARNQPTPVGPRLVSQSTPPLQLHIEFIPAPLLGNSRRVDAEEKKRNASERDAARQRQIDEIVALIRERIPQMETARAAGKSYRIAVLGRARKSLAPIALALRQANIAFRAIELEELRQRPEIVDALALARAWMNPQDRVAWLGVLRAPWCGFSLDDLYKIAGDSESGLLNRPVPELLAERLSLVSAEAQRAGERVLDAIATTRQLRSQYPATALGSWMEHVWLQLGGAACVDAAARANLDLLWKSFDNLPEGEADLLGPALDEALARLTAQPDPAADSNCGVQLMTIHKSKGLEFEIVIVPELETRPARNQPEMLSWLERGVAPEPGEFDPGVVTEFLVAPMPSKGAESGAAKRWVDRVRHNRENQEMRRLLYVAATRAREELHLFARPSYRYDENGQPALAGPGESLLATAWPAWEQEIRAQFEQWQNSAPETLETLAAAAEDNLLEMSPPARATTLRRLPADFATPRIATIAPDSPLSGAGSLFERHEGGLLSRAFGQAVHDLMLQLAQLFQSHAPHDACAVLEKFTPRMETSIRAAGIDRAQAGRLASHRTMDSFTALRCRQRGLLDRGLQRQIAYRAARPHIPRRKRASRQRFQRRIVVDHRL